MPRLSSRRGRIVGKPNLPIDVYDIEKRGRPHPKVGVRDGDITFHTFPEELKDEFAQRMIESNPDLVYLLIENQSGVSVHFAWNAKPYVNARHTIPNGGNLELENVVPTNELFMQSSTGDVTITVTRGYRARPR